MAKTIPIQAAPAMVNPAGAQADGLGCHSGAETMLAAAQAAGKSDILARYAEDYPRKAEAGPHDHMDLVTDRGVLRLHDPRRFGAVVWAPGEDSPQAQKLLGRLGVEPLSAQFDVAAFAQALKKRQSAIKQVLLAGDEVVGVGNIYASEALFMSGIRPTTKASRLSKPRVARLHAAIVQVLTRAVEQGGSSLKDFVNAEGRTGYFQLEAAVYGRAGEPCRVCATPIRSMLQGQRTTFYCPTCQKP